MEAGVLAYLLTRRPKPQSKENRQMALSSSSAGFEKIAGKSLKN